MVEMETSTLFKSGEKDKREQRLATGGVKVAANWFCRNYRPILDWGREQGSERRLGCGFSEGDGRQGRVHASQCETENTEVGVT